MMLKRDLEEVQVLNSALQAEVSSLKKEVDYLKKREENLIIENKKIKELYKDELEKQALDIDKFK